MPTASAMPTPRTPNRRPMNPPPRRFHRKPGPPTSNQSAATSCLATQTLADAGVTGYRSNHRPVNINAPPEKPQLLQNSICAGLEAPFDEMRNGCLLGIRALEIKNEGRVSRKDVP